MLLCALSVGAFSRPAWGGDTGISGVVTADSMVTVDSLHSESKPVDTTVVAPTFHPVADRADNDTIDTDITLLSDTVGETDSVAGSDSLAVNLSDSIEETQRSILRRHEASVDSTRRRLLSRRRITAG
ncbi:MAG: hypothetical protein K2G05_01035, partial [Duncaniella sp.]|nr:hypothetical protein [Duncaniella sp.]